MLSYLPVDEENSFGGREGMFGVKKYGDLDYFSSKFE